ncbi:MAG: PAS domain-containing protein [Myxococcales bacterium]
MTWARRISAAVACIAGLVLLGWCLAFEPLQTFIPARRVTRPESAIGFLLAVVGVWGLGSKRASMRHVATVAALLCGAIGATALTLHALDTTISLQLLLPQSPGGARLTSVPAASGLCMTSLALLASRSRDRWALWVFDVATVSTFVVGTLGILASLYGWYEASSLAMAFRNTAFPSGLCLMGLGLSTALLHPERGLVSRVLEVGPSGTLLRRLLPAAVLLPAVMGFFENAAARNGWFAGFGNAPFVVAEAAGIVWLVALSARSVRRFDAQRETTQRALEEEMRAHSSLLTERELRFRLLAETAPQIVWTARPDGALDYLSSAWSRFTGVPEERSHGWHWDECIHPQDLARVVQRWKEAAEAGESYELEYRLRRHDGDYRWFLSRAIPSRDSDGRVTRWYGADTDVHELHEAREALRMSEARFRLALGDRAFIAWTQDAHLRYTWVYNPAAGYEPERSIGRTDFDVLDMRGDAERLVAIKRSVLETGESFSGQVPLMIKGEQRYYEMRLNSLLDGAGEVTGLAGAAYDITDRKRSEELLLSAQKYESIAQLAGGVAHDFNNLLTGIIGNADYVLGKLPSSTPTSLRVALTRVIDSGESAAELTQQLLAYAGKGRFHVQPTDLRRLKDSLSGLVRASVPSGVRVEYDVPSDLPLVRADENQLQQMLTNLLLNAIEAIGDHHGVVHMVMRAVTLDAASASTLDVPDASDGSYVQIEVRDDGPGMPEETLQRAFEPFFSTKFIGRGLGLSAAQGIAHAHGGGIVAHSKPGDGATILVTLPALREPALRASAPVTRTDTVERPFAFPGAGVLFVDDEAQLREIGRLSLTEAGYRVFIAENGAEALEIMARIHEQIDVIVLDMTMPVMGGAEAARSLRKERVGVPIVASSGYSESETLERFGDIAPLFLRKPYRPNELLAVVASALDQVRAGRSASGERQSTLRG